MSDQIFKGRKHKEVFLGEHHLQESNLRRLILKIHYIANKDTPTQFKFDQIVSLIAGHLAADMCSIYILRPGDVLELFCTHGLKNNAHKKLKLRIGEGLTGTVAARGTPLTTHDIKNHKLFVFKPEIGEDELNSFLGIPIMRYGRALGVLVVQDQRQRHYEKNDIEDLITLSLVLTEIIVENDLATLNDIPSLDSDRSDSFFAEGTVLHKGLAIAPAILHQSRLPIKRTVADDPLAEQRRLQESILNLYASLEELFQTTTLSNDIKSDELLDTFRMFAEDRGWLKKINRSIKDGLTAEAAVYRTQLEMQMRFNEIESAYLKERIYDLEDLSNRLMRHLHGLDKKINQQTNDDFILVAKRMGPADLLEYDTKKIKGLLLEEGTTTGHVTIIAKALNIPVISNITGILTRVESGDLIAIDGEKGRIYLRPNDDACFFFYERIEEQKTPQKIKEPKTPNVSLDGKIITLMMNAGLPNDLNDLDSFSFDAIGLYRTEIALMTEPSFPDITRQTEIYKDIFKCAKNKPIYFRTFDVGGDKPLPFWQKFSDENPILGWRALRIAHQRPVFLKYQIRALLHAAHQTKTKNLYITLPMIADVFEFDFAKKIIMSEKEKHPSDVNIHLGIMLEVPSIILQLEQLAPKINFLSIGSNDLFQFFFAIDRNHPNLANHFDVLSPTFLKLLRQILKISQEHNIPVRVCGEMASHPLEALTLLALGYENLSIPKSSIAAIKKMIASAPIEKTNLFLNEILEKYSHHKSLRNIIKNYAQDCHIVA